METEEEYMVPTKGSNWENEQPASTQLLKTSASDENIMNDNDDTLDDGQVAVDHSTPTRTSVNMAGIVQSTNADTNTTRNNNNNDHVSSEDVSGRSSSIGDIEAIIDKYPSSNNNSVSDYWESDLNDPSESSLDQHQAMVLALQGKTSAPMVKQQQQQQQQRLESQEEEHHHGGSSTSPDNAYLSSSVSHHHPNPGAIVANQVAPLNPPRQQKSSSISSASSRRSRRGSMRVPGDEGSSEDNTTANDKEESEEAEERRKREFQERLAALERQNSPNHRNNNTSKKNNNKKRRKRRRKIKWTRDLIPIIGSLVLLAAGVGVVVYLLIGPNDKESSPSPPSPTSSPTTELDPNSSRGRALISTDQYNDDDFFNFDSTTAIEGCKAILDGKPVAGQEFMPSWTEEVALEIVTAWDEDRSTFPEQLRSDVYNKTKESVLPSLLGCLDVDRDALLPGDTSTDTHVRRRKGRISFEESDQGPDEEAARYSSSNNDIIIANGRISSISSHPGQSCREEASSGTCHRVELKFEFWLQKWDSSADRWTPPHQHRHHRPFADAEMTILRTGMLVAEMRTIGYVREARVIDVAEMAQLK